MPYPALSPAAVMVVPFELSETEVACGVTLDVVRAVARDAWVLAGGETVIMPYQTGTGAVYGPAVLGAAARLRLNTPVDFVRINHAGLPVYAKEGTVAR
jgi:hypothetical protein